jgi:co-chaperonin GroES (HSP10)
MRERLLKSSQKHEFVPARFNGVNCSGYHPIGDHILVLPDKASEMSSGGIEIPPEIVERYTMAAETGILIALGDDAFLWNGDRTRKWEGVKPKAGDRIYMQRYSGQVMLGEDGEFYRVMDANCIAAVKVNVPFAIINQKETGK